MAYSLKENQIVLSIAVALALYDFFSLPFASFLVSCVFAATLFFITKSIFIVAFIFFIPQIIRISNVLLGHKEKMTDLPTNVANRIKSMKAKYDSGENLNPETPTKENFTNAQEVSQRNIDIRNKNNLAKVNEVSGVVDVTMPSGTYPIEGNPSYPNFMSEGFMGTNINTNNRIETIPEEEISAVGTMENNPRANNVVESYDDESVNAALARNSNTKFASSNMKSVDMTM